MNDSVWFNFDRGYTKRAEEYFDKFMNNTLNVYWIVQDSSDREFIWGNKP